MSESKIERIFVSEKRPLIRKMFATFAFLAAHGLLYTTPCSHDDRGHMFTDYTRGRILIGKTFNRISNNRYFTVNEAISEMAAVPEMASAAFIPADAEFVRKLKTEYPPVTTTFTELVIHDKSLVCIYNRNAYAIYKPDTRIWSVGANNVTAFAQSIAPFVEFIEMNVPY